MNPLPIPPSLQLLLLALFVFRVSFLLVEEEGMGNAAGWLRKDVLGVEPSRSAAEQNTLIAGVFSCMWCMSFWWGVITTIVYYFYPVELIWIALPFAFSTVSMIIGHFVESY